jgi:hypothetical protein
MRLNRYGGDNTGINWISMGSNIPIDMRMLSLYVANMG